MLRSTRVLTRTALALTPLALLAAPLSAQVGGASESGMVLGHTTISAGGYGINTLGYTADSNLSQFGVGDEMSSATYIMQSGVSWIDPSITTNEPIIAGVRPGYGEWDGNEPIQVFGYNFSASGGGLLNVDLGSGAATAVNVISNVQASATSPQGTDPFGNPLAQVDVTVSNLNGTQTRPEAYLYDPAILELDFAFVGGTFDWVFYTNPGDGIDDLYFVTIKPTLFAGGAAVVPIGGLQGGLALNLPTNFFLVNGVFVSPTGVDRLTTPIPNNPAFAGGSIFVQGAYLNSIFPLGGAFSNAHQLTFYAQP